MIGTVRTATLGLHVTLPGLRPIPNARTYDLGITAATGLPRRGFRSIRGFIQADQDFIVYLFHHPRVAGTSYIEQFNSVVVAGTPTVVLNDVLLQGRTWGIQIDNQSGVNQAAISHHLELEP